MMNEQEKCTTPSHSHTTPSSSNDSPAGKMMMEPANHPQHEGSSTTVEVIRPGLVVVRNICGSRTDETAIVSRFLEIGEHFTDGFYSTNPDGTRQLNSTKTRGRIYRELDFYGEEVCNWVLEHCGKAVRLAQQCDSTMPTMTPTHALLLYYSTNRGIGEHRDDGENDGEGDAPIVSFNFGKSVLYQVRTSKEEPKEDVRLESGDVILFGGPCRMIYHSVKICKDKEGASPYPEVLTNRMNLTLRYAPGVLGREESFRTFQSGALFWKDKKMKTNKQT